MNKNLLRLLGFQILGLGLVLSVIEFFLTTVGWWFDGLVLIYFTIGEAPKMRSEDHCKPFMIPLTGNSLRRFKQLH